MKNVSGKTALITGGASGMGLGMAKAFAAAGMNVAIADIDAQRLQDSEALIRSYGVKALGVILNVADLGAWRPTLDRIEIELGNISVLCNNAGIGTSGVLWEADPAQWWRQFEVNVRGPFNGCRMVLPRMLARGEEAHVLTTASISGLINTIGMAGYDGSKHATVGMMTTLREELKGSNVGITLMYPGATASGFQNNSLAAYNETAQKSELAHRQTAVSDQMAIGMNPDHIGKRALQAILNNEFHVFTHAEWKPWFEQMYAERLAAFGGNADPEFKDSIPAMREAAATMFRRF